MSSTRSPAISVLSLAAHESEPWRATAPSAARPSSSTSFIPPEDPLKKPATIAPADGRLAVLLPGLGAVATTAIAGVMLARRGLATPVGSLTQMGTIRLGARTEGRSPRMKDYLPLAAL